MQARHKKVAVIVAVLVAVGSALTACGGGGNSGSGSGDKLTVGAVYLDTQGFYGGVRKGVQDGSEDAGKEVKITETNAQGDASKESQFVSSLTSSRVDAILISAVSAKGSVPAIKQAADADIPVICYNTCVGEKDMEEFVYAYAYGDPVDFGYKLGQVAADYFVKEGIKDPKIGVLNCEFVEVCVQRREGFEKALKEKVPGYEIAANQEGTVVDKAVKVGENIITANSDLDAFFGESGGATEGAIKAVEKRGKEGQIVVFGSDMTTTIAKALVDGTILKGEVDVSGQGLGKVAVQLAIDAAEGKERDEVAELVDIDLYTSAEDGKGWLEAHPDGIP